MRILIVKLTSLGDVIHTLPAITDIARKLPETRIDWLVEESFSQIPSWHPNISTIYTAATRRWRKQPVNFISEMRVLSRQLKAQPYDMIIDAQGLFKSAGLARLAKGKRVGYDKFSIKEPAASKLYDVKISVDRDIHAVNRTRQLLAGSLGYSLNILLDYGLNRNQFGKPDVGGDYLVFLHGTTWDSKQWPVAHWQQLVQIAKSNGLQVMLLWGDKAEQQRALKIAGNQPGAVVCPKLSLQQIACLLSHAQGIVAVDTGLGHLAAALSTPCISLYGATDSSRTGTIGSSQKHLQAVFECSPCLKRQCDYRGECSNKPACFDQFTAQVVWQQLEQLMSEKQNV